MIEQLLPEPGIELLAQILLAPKRDLIRSIPCQILDTLGDFTVHIGYSDFAPILLFAAFGCSVMPSGTGPKSSSSLMMTGSGGGGSSLPNIIAGSHREMVGQAVNHVNRFHGTAAQKADLFEHLAKQITNHSGGGWSAARQLGADGSHIFAGRLGEALVISPSGKVFRGNLNHAQEFIMGKTFQPVYDVLKEIK